MDRIPRKGRLVHNGDEEGVFVGGVFKSVVGDENTVGVLNGGRVCEK